MATAKKIVSKNATHDVDSGAGSTGSLPICANVGIDVINNKDASAIRAVTDLSIFTMT